jgi:hypothetical protein
MGGLLMAQDQPVQPAQSAHLSESQRRALASQSPSVKTHSRKHSYKPTKYQVTENKTTIVATRPFGN